MTDPTTPAPVPPYAAHHYPNPAPPAGPSSYPGLQQPYPGAPPVWQQPEPPQPSASPVLAGIALALAIVGVLAAFVPFVGVVAAWLFLVPAVVLGIVALVRRGPGRGMAIASIVVAGVGGLIAVLWSVAFAFLGSFVGSFSGPVTDEPYTDDDYYSAPSLGVDAGIGGASREDALPFDTEITIIDDSTGDAVWSIVVGTPEDATAAAVGVNDAPPLNGAYVAVPVEVTNLTDEAIDLDVQYEYSLYSWLLTGDGGRAETTYLSDTDRYPAVWDVGVIEPGDTVTYYDVYDVGATVVSTGYLVFDLDAGPLFVGP